MNIECPYCRQNDKVRKYGFYKGTQRYFCNRCRKKITSETIGEKTQIREYMIKQGRKSQGIVKIAHDIKCVFGYTLHFSTVYEQLKKHGIPMHRGGSGQKRKEPHIISTYEHECALAGNTGITIIDEMTRDTEVRQQAALECLIIGLDMLSEDDIRDIIREVKRKKRNELLKCQCSTVSLYKKASNSVDEGRLIIDTIRNDKSPDPCDIVCGVG